MTQRKTNVPIQEILERLKTETVVKSVHVQDVEILVYPQVFSPEFSFSPDFLIDQLDIQEGMSVLDLGCGTGVLSIFALKKGAGKLVALDINPQAVNNTNANFAHHGFSHCAEARLSDCYSALEATEEFDRIVFNPPFYNRSPHSDLEKACFDENHQFLQHAVRQSVKHLKAQGLLQMVFGHVDDLPHVQNMLNGTGLTLESTMIQRLPNSHPRMVWNVRHHDAPQLDAPFQDSSP